MSRWPRPRDRTTRTTSSASIRVPARAGREGRGQPGQLLLPVRRLRGRLPGDDLQRRFNPREIMLKVLYGLGDELLERGLGPLAVHQLLQLPRALPAGGQAGRGDHLAEEHAGRPRDLPRAAAKRSSRPSRRPGARSPVSPAVDRQRERFGLPPLTAGPDGGDPALLSPAEGSTAADGAGPSRRRAAPAPRRTEALRLLPRLPDPGPAPGDGVRHPQDARRRSGIEIVDLEGASCCPDPIYFKSKDKLSWLSVAARNLTPGRGAGPGHLHQLLRLHRDALRDLPPARGREAAGAGQRAAGEDRPASTRARPGCRHIATLLRDEVGYDAIREVGRCGRSTGSRWRSTTAATCSSRAASCRWTTRTTPRSWRSWSRPSAPRRCATATGTSAAARPARTRTSPTNMMHDLLGDGARGGGGAALPDLPDLLRPVRPRPGEGRQAVRGGLPHPGHLLPAAPGLRPGRPLRRAGLRASALQAGVPAPLRGVGRRRTPASA